MRDLSFWLLFAILSPPLALAADGKTQATPPTAMLATDPGYSMLRLFLVDEHYLTAIRWVKTVLSFGGISPDSVQLIDDISQYAEAALQELDALVLEKPEIAFNPFDENSIAISTFDALRYATAKQLFLDSTHFEKNLLLSQVQILPVIQHLSQQLAENESNAARKIWLLKLSKKFASFNQRAQAMFELTPTSK